MDAFAFFRHVVKPNYDASNRDPDNLTSLWNAIVSMNTVAEYVALDRLNYDQSLRRVDIDREASKIRNQFIDLETVKQCAETFKHVRRHSGLSVATSTGVYPEEPSTYKIGQYDLRVVLDQAFLTVTKFPELK